MLKQLPASQWNYTTAAHLLSRAGFGGPPREIEELVRLGPDKAVDRLVDFDAIADPTPNPEWAKPDATRQDRERETRRVIGELQAELKKAATPEERQEVLRKIEEARRKANAEDRRIQAERMTELRGWWLERMAKGPRPLQEKLTLFWHGHFATSVTKVRDACYMWLQNDTFRRNAAGNWRTMLQEITQDPAMLIWLDQAQSNKQHPNENYAREVMELFALGEGHYTEEDILEAARALTGLTLDRRSQRCVYNPRIHDDGQKKILGRTGDFGWKDVLDIILDQPQAAQFIAYKLWRFFASEDVTQAPIDALAEIFRKNNYQLKPLLRAMFRCEEFYAPDVVGTQVKSPVQWLVSAVRALETDLPPVRVSAPLLARLGQNLFEPPNVKGWDGGVAWVSTNNMLDRYNAAAMLVFGPGAILSAVADRNPKAAKVARALRQTPPARVDLEKIVPSEARQSREAVIAAVERRLILTTLNARRVATLRDYLASQAELDDTDLLHTIRLVMCTPEFQLT